MKQYIKKNYPEYDTITTLKDDAIDEDYKNRLKKEVNNIYELNTKSNTLSDSADKYR